MGGTPWWITLIIGIVTVSATYYAVRRGAGATNDATHQRESADSRAEWFRRVQWASEFTLRETEESRTIGYELLDVLAKSKLANEDDLKLVAVLNKNDALATIDQALQLDEDVIVEDDDLDTEEDADGQE